MNRAIVTVSIIVPVALFALLYTRKAQASEQTGDTITIPDRIERPYINPNTDEQSMIMNNPLNIKWNAANNWLGQKGKNSRGFVIFDDPKNCYRAGARILKSYAKRGVDTIPEIINTYAPPSDNNPVESYINFVCKKTGFNRVQKITPENYTDLLIAMTIFEIGNFPYSRSLVESGVRAA